MLEPHPPHHTPNSWRDFFIHIATICVGLLIAIGLEQTVEAVHRHHEAVALREDLKAESEQIVSDCRDADAGTTSYLDWLSARVHQIQATVWEHQLLAPQPPKPNPRFSSPDTPLWRAAKASARTTLLTKGEVNAYSEVEYVQTHMEAQATKIGGAAGEVISFERRYPPLPNGEPDFTKASSQDLIHYLGLLTTESSLMEEYQVWIQLLLGAETAVQEGKTQLSDFYAAENKAVRGTHKHIW